MNNEEKLLSRIEELSRVLENFAAALALAAKMADEPTRESYLGWVQEIQKVLERNWKNE